MYMDSKTFRLYNYLEEMECPERVIKIDEMIAPTVSLLNKKGYLTYAACAGHLEVHNENGKDNTFSYNPKLYIAFKCNMLEEFNRLNNILPELCEVFSIEYEHNSGREIVDYTKKEGHYDYGTQNVTEISIIRISDKEKNNIKDEYNRFIDNPGLIYYCFRDLAIYNHILYMWALSLPDKNKRKRKCKKKRYTKK